MDFISVQLEKFKKNLFNLLNYPLLQGLKEKVTDLDLAQGKEILLPMKLCVALSGGADSTFLTYMLDLMIKEGTKFMVFPVIIDHGLRRESEEEAKLVQNYSQDRFSFKQVKIIRWLANKPKANIHALARAARYELLREFCVQYTIPYLLTGHHQDDQAETVLLRIARGSGISGLVGINNTLTLSSSNNNLQLKIVRPLLNFSRQDIEKTLHLADIQYIQDPSNMNDQFTRTKVRKMLKQWQEIDQTITQRLVLLSQNAVRCEDFLQTCLEEAQTSVYTFLPNGSVLLDRIALLSLHSELALRLLRRVIQKVRDDITIIPRLSSLNRLYAKIQEFHQLEFKKEISLPKKLNSQRLILTLGGCLFSNYKKNYILVKLEKGKKIGQP